MSQETIETLNQKVLIGFTDTRGHAWHYSADAQGDESNHYPGAIPVEDIERRLFNFEPQIIPVTYEWNGEERTSKFILVVDDQDGDVLGCHGEDYVTHSYKKWLLDNVSHILDSKLQPGSAALLRGDRVAFVQVEMPDNVKTPEGVEFRPNLLAVTSTDGSVATTYKRTATNVVCDNTMFAGLREQGQEYKVKHTKNSEVRLQDAKDALAVLYETKDSFEQHVKTLCETKVSEGDWAKFLDEICPVPEADYATRDKTGEQFVTNSRGITMAENKRADLTEMYHSDNRVSDWKGTAWGVVQAVNTYEHHESIVRGQSRQHKNMFAAVSGKYDQLDQSTIESLNKVLAAK